MLFEKFLNTISIFFYDLYNVYTRIMLPYFNIPL